MTDLNSAPLAHLSIVLRNRASGAEVRATTARNGGFRFPSLAAGEYSLEADEPRLGHARLEGIVVTGGIESRIQAAIRFEPSPRPLLAATAPDRIAAPPASPPVLSARSVSPAPQTSSAPEPLLIAAVPALPPTSLQPKVVSSNRLGEPASLEIESVAGLALTMAVPRNLPLSPRTEPSHVAASAAVAAVQAAVVRNPAHLGMIAAASEKFDPAAPAVETNLTSSQLQTLPASGRRWQEFLLDTPATTAGPGAGQPSFRGAGLPSAGITLDGVSTRLAFGVVAGSNATSQALDPSSDETGRQNSPNQGWPSGRGLGVSEAAIREVTTTAGNAEAEGMRSAGGLTGIRTQSGTHALHGQGFLFDRQNTWGARNPFTQWVKNLGTAAAPDFTSQPFTPPDHELVVGFGAGGRIRSDKLFWFGALDTYNRNDPAVTMARHPDQFFAQPSNAQMQLLSAQLGLPGNNPVDEGLAAYWPTLESLAALLGPAPRSAAQSLGFGRVDWQATELQRFALEGMGATWNAPGGGFTRVSESYGNHSFGSSQAGEEWLLARWEAFLTPNLLAVTQASAGREIFSAHPETPSAFEQPFLDGNVWGQLPQIAVDSRYGFTIGNPSRFGQGNYPDEKLFHAQEMVDWVHDKLLLRAGFELDHDMDSTSFLRNQTGTYVYSKVENFVSDALAFEKYGFADALDPENPHNCDVTGKPWYAPNGQLMGLGPVPCYSYYSQTMGPAKWSLSTNDWGGFTTGQWQVARLAVVSAGLRWELEQMPLPIAALANPDLSFAGKPPSPGGNWGPRVSLAVGEARSHWPVLRLGYGMYYARVENAVIETALTQTGSLKGDLNFFMRPQDDCQNCTGGAPPFPYVFAGQPSSVVKPAVVGFAPRFRNPEVHQAVAAVEQSLPGGIKMTASAMLSLGRRLPVSVDTNINSSMNANPSDTVNAGITYDVCDNTPPTPTGSGNTNGQCGNMGLGPIKATQITVPYFYASWPGSAATATCPYYSPQPSDVLLGRLCPDYQAITQITSKANSTYEAAVVRLVRNGPRGLSFHAHYTYAHAMDWNPNETTLAAGSDVLDPNLPFREEYGASNLDVRHSAALMAVFEAPWKLRGSAGRITNGWMLSGIGQYRSGLPYTMRVTGSLPEEFTSTGTAIVGLGPGMNGSGGENRVYGVGNDGLIYDIGRNTFRYPNTWKADLRLAKRFNLGEMRQLELLAESFNLFNHQNVTGLETTGYSIEPGSPPAALGAPATSPSLNFLTGLKVNQTTGLASPAFGQPLNINATDFYRERQIQLGLHMRF